MNENFNEYHETGNPYQPPREILEPIELTNMELSGAVNISPMKLLKTTWRISFYRYKKLIHLGCICGGIILLTFVAVIIITNTLGCSAALSTAIKIRLTAAIGIAFICIFAAVFAGSVRYCVCLLREGDAKIRLVFEDSTLGLRYIISSLVIIAFGFVLASPFFAASYLYETHTALSDYAKIFLQYGWLLYIFIIPAAIVRLCWNVAFIADRNEGPIRSIISSIRFSKGYWIDLILFFVLQFISMYIFLAISIALGGITLSLISIPILQFFLESRFVLPMILTIVVPSVYILFVFPELCCSIAVVYLSITGQKITEHIKPSE